MRTNRFNRAIPEENCTRESMFRAMCNDLWFCVELQNKELSGPSTVYPYFSGLLFYPQWPLQKQVSTNSPSCEYYFWNSPGPNIYSRKSEEMVY